MRNIETLERQLRYEDFITGRDLFTAMLEVGMNPEKAAALCYSAGKCDYRDEARARRKEQYAAKAVERTAREEKIDYVLECIKSLPYLSTQPSQPEAEEGSNDNERTE